MWKISSSRPQIRLLCPADPEENVPEFYDIFKDNDDDQSDVSVNFASWRNEIHKQRQNRSNIFDNIRNEHVRLTKTQFFWFRLTKKFRTTRTTLLVKFKPKRDKEWTSKPSTDDSGKKVEDGFYSNICSFRITGARYELHRLCVKDTVGNFALAYQKKKACRSFAN